MEKIRVAFASDDGKNLMGRHFGDAEFYEIMDVNPSGSEVIRRLANDLDEEEGHADPKKAKGIGGLLGKSGVQVVVSRVFGPNIKRIKKRFVCVLTGHQEIAECVVQLGEHFEDIVAEWEKGQERGFLDYRKE